MPSSALHGFALVTVAAGMTLSVAVGCSDEPPPERPKPSGSHVWRGQTDLLFEAKDRAKDINAQLESREAAMERARRGE